MSRLRYNKTKWRYEVRLANGRHLAVDETLVLDIAFHAWKDAGARGSADVFLGPDAPWLQAEYWQDMADAGSNADCYYFELLGEAVEEETRKEAAERTKAETLIHKKATRGKIQSYLLEHPNTTDNRRVAKTLETTIFQVRRVRREMAQSNGER